MFNKQHDTYFILDSKESKIGIGIDIALPGYTKDSINISTSSFGIKIESDGIKRTEESRLYVNDHNLIDREAFSVEYAIPEDCDLDKITATFNNGILSVKIPLAKQKTRLIKIS